MTSLEIFNEILIENDLAPLTEGEARDWNLSEELTEVEIATLAHDLIMEEHSVKCENKNAWMYEY